MAAEAGTHVPGIGHLSKKELYIGGGAAIVVIGFAVYRSHQKSQAAAAAAAAAANTDTSGGDDSGAIDPTTGDIAGSPEDVSALEAQSEYANDTDYGYSSGGYDNTDAYSSTTGYTSNAAWSQAAEEYITNYSGGDAATVSAALGAYITGSYVTAAQQQLVEQAIAFEGAPPQPGSNGYPPSLNTTPPSTGTSTSTGTTSTKTIAQSVGKVISIPENISSFGNLTKMGEHFGISAAHIVAFNPGLSLTATTGLVNIPILIESNTTLESLAAAFGQAPEHIEIVLESQGIT